MGRFVSPQSLRLGSLNDWTPISESRQNFWKSKVFLQYLEGLLTKNLLLSDGILFGNIQISYEKERVVLEISIYDRPLELMLRDAYIQKKDMKLLLEKSILKKLAYLKCLIRLEGSKYFKVPVEINFKGLGLRNLNASLLAKYVSLCLEQGYSLQEVLRLISRELGGNPQVNKDKANQGDNLTILPHRGLSTYTEEQKKFQPYYIGNKKLLGFRLDCSGRFSRKQRASKKSIREGTISLGSYSGYLDYGSHTSILEYGACGIKVWLYFEQNIQEFRNEYNYLFKY